ncbi:MAG: Ribonuclease 3 [Mesotoga prima]|jgi:ribonuclease-3|uniref:Ribonuclease 3 n=1 Tax=Mesotoga prima TaxID=1184387 RepID=A0A117M3I4_9BACT|nr:MAG: Ribonuclease 3 [Mesotoga prima]
MLSVEEEKQVNEFCRINGIEANRELAFRALCHSSFTNELAQNGERILESNERMEFLGDAVLELSLAKTLFDEYSLSEGDMSKIRAMVGSEKVLSDVARFMRIGDFVFLGKGERQTGGSDRDSILADTFEAVLAAVFLTSGFEASVSFVQSKLCDYIDQAVNGELILDHKTSLQELTQARFSSRPSYETILDEGPPQDKWFKVGVFLDGKIVGEGEGRTKKAAEQLAAKHALEALRKGLDKAGAEK